MITVDSKEAPYILDGHIGKHILVLGRIDQAYVLANRVIKGLILQGDTRIKSNIPLGELFIHPLVHMGGSEAGVTYVEVYDPDDLSVPATTPGHLVLIGKNIPRWVWDKWPELQTANALPIQDVPGETYFQRQLADSDYLVLRELERMFLADSPISLEREALRVRAASVSSQGKP